MLSSCLFSTRQDDAEDKAAAEAVISKLLVYRKHKDGQKINKMFSDRFYRRNDSNYVKHAMKENYEKYGDITNIKLLTASVHTTTHLFRTMGNGIFIYQLTSKLGTWKEAYGLTLKDGEYEISNFKILKTKASVKKPSIND